MNARSKQMYLVKLSCKPRTDVRSSVQMTPRPDEAIAMMVMEIYGPMATVEVPGLIKLGKPYDLTVQLGTQGYPITTTVELASVEAVMEVVEKSFGPIDNTTLDLLRFFLIRNNHPSLEAV